MNVVKEIAETIYTLEDLESVKLEHLKRIVAGELEPVIDALVRARDEWECSDVRADISEVLTMLGEHEDFQEAS